MEDGKQMLCVTLEPIDDPVAPIDEFSDVWALKLRNHAAGQWEERDLFSSFDQSLDYKLSVSGRITLNVALDGS
jgi:hypothetical protein